MWTLLPAIAITDAMLAAMPSMIVSTVRPLVTLLAQRVRDVHAGLDVAARAVDVQADRVHTRWQRRELFDECARGYPDRFAPEPVYFVIDPIADEVDDVDFSDGGGRGLVLYAVPLAQFHNR
jgi:hypothetical protein